MKPSTLNANSGLLCLVDNRAALLAAERLAAQTESGIRFCCEHREKLTVVEGRKRDQADSSRRAKYQQSMAELEQRMAVADQVDEAISSEDASAREDQIDDDLGTESDLFDETIESLGQPLEGMDSEDFAGMEFSEDYDEALA